MAEPQVRKKSEARPEDFDHHAGHQVYDEHCDEDDDSDEPGIEPVFVDHTLPIDHHVIDENLAVISVKKDHDLHHIHQYQAVNRNSFRDLSHPKIDSIKRFSTAGCDENVIDQIQKLSNVSTKSLCHKVESSEGEDSGEEEPPDEDLAPKPGEEEVLLDVKVIHTNKPNSPCPFLEDEIEKARMEQAAAAKDKDKASQNSPKKNEKELEGFTDKSPNKDSEAHGSGKKKPQDNLKQKSEGAQHLNPEGKLSSCEHKLTPSSSFTDKVREAGEKVKDAVTKTITTIKNIGRKETTKEEDNAEKSSTSVVLSPKQSLDRLPTAATAEKGSALAENISDAVSIKLSQKSSTNSLDGTSTARLQIHNHPHEMRIKSDNSVADVDVAEHKGGSQSSLPQLKDSKASLSNLISPKHSQAQEKDGDPEKQATSKG